MQTIKVSRILNFCHLINKQNGGAYKQTGAVHLIYATPPATQRCIGTHLASI